MSIQKLRNAIADLEVQRQLVSEAWLLVEECLDTTPGYRYTVLLIERMDECLLEAWNTLYSAMGGRDAESS